jgi:hypothetical protein
VAHLSPLGWDHINLTGDYLWSDSIERDPDGFLPLRLNAEPAYRVCAPIMYWGHIGRPKQPNAIMGWTVLQPRREQWTR